MSREYYDIEQLLKEGKTLRIQPQGYSMYPLFIPGRDEALLKQFPIETLHRNDVVLYRRSQGILVLHRIWKITPEGFYMVGDHQSQPEGPLKPEQIHGVLIAFIRKGRRISVKHPIYRLLSSLWLRMLPIRPACFRLTAFFRSLK